DIIAEASPDIVIAATGGVRDTLGLSDTAGTKVVGIDDFMMADIAEEVVIVGSNVQAIDAAMYLLAQGKHVQVVTPNAASAIGAGHSFWVKTFTQPNMKALGVRFWPEATVTAVNDGSVTVKTATGIEQEIACGTVVEALDCLPNDNLSTGLSCEVVTVGDAARPFNIGEAICSGNAAAVAVAEGVSGSVDKFVDQMNEKAKALGMNHSSFANPNGLDDEKHYSTARDMAILACAAVENETLVRIASTLQITIGGRTMTNHNKLLSYIDGCIGLKTGYTMAAGRTLVSCVERNGQRLVAVTLQDGNDWADHQALYEYGFAAYPISRAAVLGQPLETAEVLGGAEDTVPLVAAESFAWPLAEGEKLTTEVELDQPLTAPLSAGTRVGEAVFRLNGKEVGRVDLLCGAGVAPRLEPALHQLHLALPE
ncbi:FAD-dependent oxidoreductase, partial [uncultured Oscillibacter sp.]|uniref:FAD-dependent oxidoreductase n=1 Tax=uncultured Oscillibacter sp. TaxID=876091 RepID=UPI0025F7003A